MPSFLMDLHGGAAWGAIGGIAFALVFLGVGVYRVVEFSGLGLGPVQRPLLIAGHVLGTLLFSSAVAVVGIDSKLELRELVGVLLGAGVVILFPIHIYIGIKRRILLKKAQESEGKKN